MNLSAYLPVAGIVGQLEQSTFVVLVAWMLTLALRPNRPTVRFWIWFIASVKFLVPLAILVHAGEWLRRLAGGPARELPVAEVIRRISSPLSNSMAPVSIGLSANGHASNTVLVIVSIVWGCGSLTMMVRWWSKWRRIRGVVRDAVPSGLVRNVPVLLTSALSEPGVCGVIRPVLLLPVSITDHLSPDQLKAILSHEMSHVRRRDNLLFSIHMAVETLFWFHPLIWWVGSHLIEERELACDEAALLDGNDAKVYAQSILDVCKCRLQLSPLLVSGIAGPTLKSRISRIVEGHCGRKLGRSKVALITVIVLAFFAVPACIGLMSEAETRIESGVQESTGSLELEAASIKPGKPSARGSGVFINGRRFELINTKLEMLISFCYGVHPKQIVGAPDWMNNDEFDITAVAEGDRQPTAAQWKEMMQKLLADRFDLHFHRDTRVLPVYMLRLVRSGAKVNKSDGDPAALPMVYFPGQWGKLVARNAGIKDFAAQIQSAVLDRPVVDETGLSGRYDFTLNWTPDESQFTRINERIPPPPDGADAPPPLFTAIQEQLGLKLEAGSAHADVIVIDRLQKPSPN